VVQTGLTTITCLSGEYFGTGQLGGGGTILIICCLSCGNVSQASSTLLSLLSSRYPASSKLKLACDDERGQHENGNRFVGCVSAVCRMYVSLSHQHKGGARHQHKPQAAASQHSQYPQPAQPIPTASTANTHSQHMLTVSSVTLMPFRARQALAMS
jgi:hypothetical protein